MPDSPNDPRNVPSYLSQPSDAEAEEAQDSLRRENAILRTALNRAEERLALLSRATCDAFWENDIAGGEITLSPEWRDMLGLGDGKETIPLRGLLEYIHADDRERVRASQDAFLAGHQDELDMEFRLVGRDGRTCWAQSRSVALRDSDGSVRRIIGALNDITSRRTIEAEKDQILRLAEQRADRDPLTGLLNHRTFYQRLHDEAERSTRENRSFTVAVLDVDNFKFFNDAFGHLDGDEVLIRVADALRASFRVYDVLARIGGDEFALLLPGVGLEETERLFEEARLNHGIFSDGFTPSGQDIAVPLRLSFGVAVFPDEADSPLGALGLADERLYRNKRQETESDDARCERVRSALARKHPGFSSLYALLVAVDAKDRYSRRHSERVMLITREMVREFTREATRGSNNSHNGGGEAMGESELRDAAEVAGLLHDVGKIGIPDHILRRPTRLSDEEYARVKHHPVLGSALAQVLMPTIPEEAVQAIRHHHEAWDGSGYPEGLSGDAIPLLARIVSVAEAFAALTTDRPYRKGLSVSDALTVLRAGAGTRWDPACVTVFDRSYPGALVATVTAPT